jgi:hypothetical protein
VKTAPERIQLLYDTAHDLQRLVALFNPAPLDFRRGVELRSLLSAMRSNRLKVTITIDEPTSAIQSFSVFVTDSEGNQAAYFERLSAEGDLTGIFCTSGSEREFTQEERWYADEEIQAGADRDAATAD